MLIGISGRKRVGKDTAADILIRHYGYTRVAYGDKVKRVAAVIFGFYFIADHVREVKFQCPVFDVNIRIALNELGLGHEHLPLIYEVFAPFIVAKTDAGFDALISPREAWQYLGTEFGRRIDSDFWVSRVDLSEPLTVISDVRFDNEAQYVQSKGGIVIEIDNPRITKDQTSGHASESGVSHKYIDHFILNDKEISDLKYKIEYTLRLYS